MRTVPILSLWAYVLTFGVWSVTNRECDTNKRQWNVYWVGIAIYTLAKKVHNVPLDTSIIQCVLALHLVFQLKAAVFQDLLKLI
jgi:hypothetical protein